MNGPCGPYFYGQTTASMHGHSNAMSWHLFSIAFLLGHLLPSLGETKAHRKVLILSLGQE